MRTRMTKITSVRMAMLRKISAISVATSLMIKGVSTEYPRQQHNYYNKLLRIKAVTFLRHDAYYDFVSREVV